MEAQLEVEREPQWRQRAAVELLVEHGAALRRAARRWSICDSDADDACQRAAEILLAKAPPLERPRLAAWMHVVTRREALAVRRSRERELLPASVAADSAGHGPLELVADEGPDPSERLERDERVAAAARALAELKPQERRAIVLQAEGYSYAEICEICGWTYTKVNRCLAEGRERLRRRPGPPMSLDFGP